jgi:hypothetical protein
LTFTFRNLAGLADMVAAQLAGIRKSSLVRYWHHSTLWLFHFITFTRL